MHDLRVSMRRLIALLDMLKTVLPKSGGAGIRKQMKTSLKSLSTLRDTQVQILEVQHLAAEYGVLSPFLGKLIIHEATQTKRARKEIQRINIGPIQEYIDGLRTDINAFLAAPAMDDTCRSILLGLLAQMYVKAAAVRDDIAKIAGASNDMYEKCEEIHRLRLIFKKFRYTVEILKPVFPHVSIRALKRMDNYQSKMGTIQDTEVLITAIASYAKQTRKKEHKHGDEQPDAFAPLLDHLKDRLKEESDTFILTINELDDYWKRIE